MARTRITSGVISDEFQTSQALTGTSIDIDWNSAQVFTLTPSGNTTFTFSDFKVGMVKILVVTGSGGSPERTLTFPTEANKLGGDYDDTSNTKNFIQVVCTSNTGNGEFFYTISQPAS